MQTYDVIIIGGGMTGLALACALQNSGLSIAVIEQKPPPRLELRKASNSRVSAINEASELLLSQFGLWSKILSQHATCYHRMDIWEKDSSSYLGFDGKREGRACLGHIVENDIIHRALWDKAQQLGNLQIIAPIKLKQVGFGDKEAFITFEDGKIISGRLLAAADGTHSWLRQEAAIPLSFWDYDQCALVGTIRTEKTHENVARQVFYSQGILAFLPLNDANHCSIVWSVSHQEAARLQSLSLPSFNQQLSVAFDMRLGLCQLEDELKSFPLTARYARQFASHRLALLGDAAHTLHPLAGQGLNIGFMDAAELAGEIRRLHGEGKDIGQHLHLRRYERRRKQSAALMLAAMQGIHWLFQGQDPLKKGIRGWGLKLVDGLPSIKTHLMRQAAGLDQLPRWLAEETRRK